MNALVERIIYPSTLASKNTWLVGGLGLCLIGFAVTGCRCVKSHSTSGTEGVALDPAKVVINRLWEQTDQTIAKMRRPKRLYKVVPSKTALVVVDMQNGFCLPTACIEIPDSRKIV